jgi:Ca2+-transporting ATPase
MRQPPRPPDSPLLDRPSLHFVVGAGSLKALLALGLLGLVPWLGYGYGEARTVAFHVMAIGQLLMTYPARHTWIRPLSNPYLHAAVVLGIVIQIAAATLPLAMTFLGCAPLPTELWFLVAGSALVAWAMAEATSRVVWRRYAPAGVAA